MNYDYELVPRFDNTKSFYGKAQVKIAGNQSRLYSYDTLVAIHYSGETSQEDRIHIHDTHSATTLRHIKEFMQQFRFPLMTKGEIEEKLTEKPVKRSDLV